MSQGIYGDEGLNYPYIWGVTVFLTEGTREGNPPKSLPVRPAYWPMIWGRNIIITMHIACIEYSNSFLISTTKRSWTIRHVENANKNTFHTA